ncbi:MAG: hypothetical protein RL106_1039 [Bacteroidota bacterium]
MPKVSIVIPNYNKGIFLVETIASVQASTLKDWEIILIDDGSTDNSVELAQALADCDDRINIFLQSNQGGGKARNKGIELAKGEFLLFLDSDDLISATCLENRINIAESNKDGMGWVFPLLPFEGEFQDQRFISPWIPPKDHFLEKLIEHDITWTSMSPLWRTSFIKQHGHWNTHYPRLQDIQFHTHLLLQKSKIYTFPHLQADCYYRLDERKLVLGNRYKYLEKWVQGCGLYLEEFIPILPKPLKRKITKTSLACMEVMGHYLRNAQIDASQFDLLSKELIQSVPYPYQQLVFRIYASLLKHLPFHVPGLAKLFKFCLR